MSILNETTLARPRQVPLRGYVIVLSGTVIWALTGIVIKVLLTQYGMEPMAIAFWRVSLVTTALFLALVIFDRKAFRLATADIPIFAIYGLIGVAIHQIVWIASVQYNGAAVATVLIYIAPAFVAILAWRLLHERIDRDKLFAMALTIVGCVLVARAYELDQIQLNGSGLLAGIGSGMTLATYTLMGRLVTRRYSAWTALFYAFFFGSLFLLPAGLVTQNFVPIHMALDGWGVLLFLALVPTLGGFGAYTVGLTHLPASVASILSAFEPVTTSILAYVIFGEVLAPLQLLGAGLILCSVVMLRPREEGSK